MLLHQSHEAGQLVPDEFHPIGNFPKRLLSMTSCLMQHPTIISCLPAATGLYTYAVYYSKRISKADVVVILNAEAHEVASQQEPYHGD